MPGSHGAASGGSLFSSNLSPFNTADDLKPVSSYPFSGGQSGGSSSQPACTSFLRGAQLFLGGVCFYVVRQRSVIFIRTRTVFGDSLHHLNYTYIFFVTGMAISAPDTADMTFCRSLVFSAQKAKPSIHLFLVDIFSFVQSSMAFFSCDSCVQQFSKTSSTACILPVAPAATPPPIRSTNRWPQPSLLRLPVVVALTAHRSSLLRRRTTCGALAHLRPTLSSVVVEPQRCGRSP